MPLNSNKNKLNTENFALNFKREEILPPPVYIHPSVKVVDKRGIERNDGRRLYRNGKSDSVRIRGIQKIAVVPAEKAKSRVDLGIVHFVNAFSAVFVKNFLRGGDIFGNATRVRPDEPARAQLNSAEIARDDHRRFAKLT